MKAKVTEAQEGEKTQRTILQVFKPRVPFRFIKLNSILNLTQFPTGKKNTNSKYVQKVNNRDIDEEKLKESEID